MVVIKTYLKQLPFGHQGKMGRESSPWITKIATEYLVKKNQLTLSPMYSDDDNFSLKTT